MISSNYYKINPKLSRTCFEIGKRLSLPEGDDSNRRLRERAKKIIGLTPEEYLDKAQAMFREMDLQWDLTELGKVRNAINNNRHAFSDDIR